MIEVPRRGLDATPTRTNAAAIDVEITTLYGAGGDDARTLLADSTCPDGGNGGTGLVEFLPSTALGLTATGSSAWSRYTPGIKTDSSQLCGFGTAVA